MSVDWKKNAAVSLFKVHVNGYVYSFNPKSAKNLTAMFSVSHGNARSGDDDLLKTAFKYVGMHETPIAFGYREDCFCFTENKAF